jgi:hypothetical protein
MEELRLASSNASSRVMAEEEGCFSCLGTATGRKGEAMASVNFDQGVQCGGGLRGRTRRRG